jgi:hypothetical protein
MVGRVSSKCNCTFEKITNTSTERAEQSSREHTGRKAVKHAVV